jgi:putative hydrolase of the HAD superfamily
MGERFDIFFDLDHTLWDFEANSREALADLFEAFDLRAAGITDEAQFVADYEVHNAECWALHRAGSMHRDVLRVERFSRTLRTFGIDDAVIAEQLATAYVDISPSKTRLMPGSLEVLDYIQTRGHRLHILTNGFREVQHRKLEGSGLRSYFDGVFTSEEIGVGKPHPEAFLRALAHVKAHPSSAWMIGDSLEADIHGAEQVGLTTVLYHPADRPKPQAPHHTITHLLELKQLL